MKKISTLTVSLFVASVFSSFISTNAQLYKFQKFGVEKGICHPFVYSLNQDKNGFIWICTGTGLCRFDGFSFSSNTKDSLSESSAEVSFKDQENNLWFGQSDGGIVFFDGKQFQIFKQGENQISKINDIISDSKGNILAASQSSGIIKIDKKFKKTFIKEPFQGKLIYSINITSDNSLLIGTDEGIAIYAYNEDETKIKQIAKVEGLPLSRVTKIIKRENSDSFWVGTEDAGLFKITTARNSKFMVENFGNLIHLERENIQSVFEDKESNIWISTFGKGLFKVIMNGGQQIKDLINYNSLNGLGHDYIKDAYQDREGNLWVATYGNGIAILLNESFIYYDFKQELKRNNILSVCFDKDGYWIGGENGLLKIKTGIDKSTIVYGTSSGLPADKYTALYLDEKGTLWVGTDKNGIYQISSGAKRASSFFHANNSIGNSINSITGKKDLVYVGTKDGVYLFNLSTKNYQQFSTSQGLPHNNISQVYIDSKGNAWIATRSNMLFSLTDSLNYKITGKGNVSNVELEFTAITQDPEGHIWAGTNGNGVFKFFKDTFLYFSTREGLKSDYCYSLNTDKAGNIWVGHRLGLSRINSKTNQIKIYGTEYFSGDINYNAVSQSTEGDMLFGTTDGLVFYESSKVRKSVVPPMVNITSLIINDKSYNIKEKIVLPFSHYRLKVEFIGLNYSNPEQVTYQYKLDGFDSEWSEMSNNRTASYSRVPDGNYTFMLKACNGDGVCTEVPVTFILKIRKPFWKTWWFSTFASVLLVTLVYLIIRIRERKHKQFQEYLERLLEERTHEVRIQKEEIELKNRDITDSINYAQRIQASILPSLRKLQNFFTGSFVYYQPRNIVSGDFYWFDVIPKTSKFILVCADSTGHGVPGAFMSIIGTTLLKDIFSRPEVKKPSDILRHLDNELKSTLNQNIDGERPNDGMDIIVCEIDVKTFHARFASAMRPFIVYQNGEQLYFKGSRSSIGGQMIREEKVFEDIELQLTKGDIIYMFSDGYPDQFGGPLGKKFKMVRLRNLLKDIHEKPMEEQYNYVKSNFELWQGNLEQVDDVLFMGIKI